MICERVISPMNGRTHSGASVWPTKMFAEQDRVSLPLVPIVRCMMRAMPEISFCMTPRW